MNNASNSGNFKTAIFADCLANSKEIFQLIDQVFPLDSCQHYEVLPLKLRDHNLSLGMLDPTNSESLKFINSIAKVFKYNLDIQLIDQQTHQIILANYPQNPPQSPTARQDQNKTVIDTNFNPSLSLDNDQRRRRIDAAPTIISPAAPDSSSSTQIGAEPELPPDLDYLQDLDLTPASSPKSNKKKVDIAPTLYEIPPEFLNQQQPLNLDNKPTIIGGDPAQLLAQSTNQQAPLSDAEIAFGEAQISNLIAETLDNVPQPAESEVPQTVDFLPQLMPQLSWQKLLEQAFRHHTEYLSLSRHSDRGSIIARRNESTQSFIDRVPLPIFCSLIDEIKRMAKLPATTSSHPKKVVLERLHEQERILLRLEFSLEAEIETVGIQILRHQALKIYEQQQMDKVSEQALQLAKQLEKTLRRIQSCFDSAKLTNLGELQAVHTRISHQLRLLDK
ncbi:MAG: hypothetical protein AAGE84_09415 [Cyanobacteria bacterium P01_G01_bin.39]